MKPALIGLLGSLLLSSPGAAADSIFWKETGGWRIYMDPTMGNACYLSSAFDEGTVLRIGFDFTTKTKRMYIALGNEKWTSVQDGKDYPVEIRFDSRPAWKTMARGITASGSKWLQIPTSDPNFADEFGRKNSMHARFQGREIAALRLKGSRKAVDEMLACQKAVNEMLSSMKTRPSPPPSERVPPARKDTNGLIDL